MSPNQCVGYILNQTSAITAIAEARIYDGNRPDTTTIPCINYYAISGGEKRYGLYRQGFSINCRASTPEIAYDLARLIDDLFNGLSGSGTYGDWNGFGITRAFTNRMQGIIPEPETGIYNCPVDIFLIYPVGTIS